MKSNKEMELKNDKDIFLERHFTQRPENVPLLNEQESIEKDEQDEEMGLASPLYQKFPSLSYPQRKAIFCMLPRKKVFKKILLLSCIFSLLSNLLFVVFSLFYFSPVSLPEVESFQAGSLTSSPRILTLNIFMRPPGIKTNENDYKEQRLQYIIDHILPSYDIITFQEAFAFANSRIDRLLAAAYEQGFYYHVDSPRHYPWDLAGDGGLLMLSRFPIKEADRIEFPRGVHSDWLSYKGAVHALVEIDNENLIHIYTTHTQASYDKGGEVNFDDTKIRLSQFSYVHKFIKDTAGKDNWPVLLMGDLNVNAAVTPDPNAVDVPSYESTLAYTMMMDVLSGNGTDLRLISDIENEEESPSFKSDWYLPLTDVPYEVFGYHPATFGDYKKLGNGSLVPAETVLTSPAQFMTVQSIDRILWSGNRGVDNMSLENVTIEHFFVDKSLSLPFTQISDHYGLSVILNTKA